MNIDQIRKLCLSFPGATEQVQWEDDLVFKVAGKMFALTPLVPSRVWLSLKADPEEFLELTERPGILPAPYLARAKWVAIETPQALPAVEVASLLRKSYALVTAKLPRATLRSLTRKPAKLKRAAGKPRTRARPKHR
jgi:predicted DNA-binding protein (MmcQ/YjbR family)